MAKVKDMMEDLEQEAFERGAIDAYYGRQPTPLGRYKQFERIAYANGYDTEPYGQKDHGYEE